MKFILSLTGIFMKYRFSYIATITGILLSCTVWADVGQPIQEYSTGVKSPTSMVNGKRVVTLTSENTLDFRDYFYGQKVAQVSARARELDSKLPSGEPLYLVLDSGGGSIEAGIELIDALSSLNRPVHTISSFSASMAFQTVQGLGDRLVTEKGTLMSHQAWGMFYGEFGNGRSKFDSRYRHYLLRVQELDAQAVARTKGKHTRESYDKLIQSEYWGDPKDSISVQGFADEVVAPRCDNSLSGKTNEIWDEFLYGSYVIQIVIVRTKCPMNTGMLEWQIYVNGKPLFPRTFQDQTDETSRSGNYYERYTSEDRIKIDPEVLLSITKKVKDKVSHLQNRNVIKSGEELYELIGKK